MKHCVPALNDWPRGDRDRHVRLKLGSVPCVDSPPSTMHDRPMVPEAQDDADLFLAHGNY